MLHDEHVSGCSTDARLGERERRQDQGDGFLGGVTANDRVDKVAPDDGFRSAAVWVLKLSEEGVFRNIVDTSCNGVKTIHLVADRQCAGGGLKNVAGPASLWRLTRLRLLEVEKLLQVITVPSHTLRFWSHFARGCWVLSDSNGFWCMCVAAQSSRSRSYLEIIRGVFVIIPFEYLASYYSFRGLLDLPASSFVLIGLVFFGRGGTVPSTCVGLIHPVLSRMLTCCTQHAPLQNRSPLCVFFLLLRLFGYAVLSGLGSCLTLIFVMQTKREV